MNRGGIKPVLLNKPKPILLSTFARTNPVKIIGPFCFERVMSTSDFKVKKACFSNLKPISKAITKSSELSNRTKNLRYIRVFLEFQRRAANNFFETSKKCRL